MQVRIFPTWNSIFECMVSSPSHFLLRVAGVRGVSKTIFVYSLGLGLALAAALGLGDTTGFLLNLFTEDIPTQETLKPLLVILIIAQPLNSFVFAADGLIKLTDFTRQFRVNQPLI